jgi:hypothetical protein
MPLHEKKLLASTERISADLEEIHHPLVHIGFFRHVGEECLPQPSHPLPDDSVHALRHSYHELVPEYQSRPG